MLPLIAYRGLAGGMPIVIGLYIGHRWGLLPLGAYTYASSFAAVGLVVTDWGCQRWLPRELALVRNSGAKPAAVLTANTLRAGAAVLYFALTLALFALHAMDTQVFGYAAELGVLYFVAIFSTNAVSDRIVKSEVFGIGTAVATGIAVFLSLFLITDRIAAGPRALIGSYVAGKIAESLVLSRGRTELLRFVSAGLLHLGKRLWPFSIQAILAVVYARLSVFVMEHLRSTADVGIIGAASALQNVLLLLPTSLALLIYPSLTNAANAGDEATTARLLKRYAAVAVTGIMMGTAVVWALRRWITALLHVPYSYSTFVVVYVALSLVTAFTVIAATVLQARNREVVVARLSFVTLAAAILYQFLLIRSFGVWGTAYALAAAEFTSLAVLTWALRSAANRLRPVSPVDKDDQRSK